MLVRSHTTGRPTRRAQIIAVGPGGAPPYTVRWTDIDHEVLVFPGSDAQVMSATALAELDRQQTERLVAVQASFTASGSGPR